MAAQGFEVSHLCPQSGDEPIGKWSRGGVEIVTYPRRDGLIGRIQQLFKLYGMARGLDADAYHCNEVDSWVIGAALKLTRKKYCVVDIHEDYPSTVSEGRLPKFLRPIAAMGVRILYRALIPLTDKIVVAKKSVMPDFKAASEKIVIVQNFSPLSALASNANTPTLPQKRHKKPITIVHLGLFSKLRGWPQLLAALEMMGDTVTEYDVRLEIIGMINDGSEQDFWAKCDLLKIRDRATVRNWMPFEEAFALLQKSDIGVVLFQPGIRNHIFALPHKMFDYMLARLPILIPDCALEIRDIVEDNECGLLVDSGDPASIASALTQLIKSPEQRAQMGARGRQAVMDKFNWEAEAKKLVELYSGGPVVNQ